MLSTSLASLEVAAVVRPPAGSKPQQLDLSINNTALTDYDVGSSHSLATYLATLSDAPTLLYGGYLEQRAIYRRSQHFTTDVEVRDIHLGTDLWMPAGTGVFAPLAGTVHSFTNNEGLGNYGPTIILRHDMPDYSFHTLYGHLSLQTIANLEVGTPISKGAMIGHLGDQAVNGDYPPHLHFQIIVDMQGNSGDYPGVASMSQLARMKQNCPDPKLLVPYLR